jgi:hypothetical protein
MESVRFEYSYADESGVKVVSLSREEAQMEEMADQFADFAASVFGYGRDWVIRRTVDHLGLETTKFAAAASADVAPRILDRCGICGLPHNIGNPCAGPTVSASSATEVPCRHEWFEGRCVHCLRPASTVTGAP